MISDAFSTFLAVREAGTIGGAAHALHLSQPAVSRRLQAIETEIGAPLFERTRRGLRLTSAGEVLLPHAERVRAAHRDAAQALADHLGEPGGAVRLSIVGSLAGRWFSTVLANVRAAHPGVELIVSTGTSRQVDAHVARGDAVAGISYLRPVDDDLRSRRLFDERLVLVCHPSHPLAGARVTEIEQFTGEQWLLFPERADQSESSDAAVRRLLRTHAVPEDSIRPIDSLSAQRALALAAAGYGRAFLPSEAAADAVEAGQLRTIAWAGEPVGAAVHLVTRRSGYLGPAAQAAIESLTRTPPAE